jgi:hypothetical protein
MAEDDARLANAELYDAHGASIRAYCQAEGAEKRRESSSSRIAA